MKRVSVRNTIFIVIRYTLLWEIDLYIMFLRQNLKHRSLGLHIFCLTPAPRPPKTKIMIKMNPHPPEKQSWNSYLFFSNRMYRWISYAFHKPKILILTIHDFYVPSRNHWMAGPMWHSRIILEAPSVCKDCNGYIAHGVAWHPCTRAPQVHNCMYDGYWRRHDPATINKFL